MAVKGGRICKNGRARPRAHPDAHCVLLLEADQLRLLLLQLVHEPAERLRGGGRALSPHMLTRLATLGCHAAWLQERTHSHYGCFTGAGQHGGVDLPLDWVHALCSSAPVRQHVCAAGVLQSEMWSQLGMRLCCSDHHEPL